MITISDFKTEFSQAIDKFVLHNRAFPEELLSTARGKLYEGFTLAYLIKQLSEKEGYRFILLNGTEIRLKSKGGPINRSFPHFLVTKGDLIIGELHTDIEFLTTSYENRGNGTEPLTKGDYHEIDIVLVKRHSPGRPRPSDILIAVECKDTSYEKYYLREALGIRRELGYSTMGNPIPLPFHSWPQSTVCYSP